MIDKKDLKVLLDFAESNVKKAGNILLNERSKISVIKKKDAQDIATSADIASEEFIISSIKKKYPKHGIVSEEAGEDISSSDYCWFIDPLDGTKEYIRDIPLYNVSIGLEHKGQALVSAVYRPAEDVLYSAAKVLGSFKNKRKIEVSNINRLDYGFVYCYLPSHKGNKDTYKTSWNKLAKLGEKAYRLRALADGNTALCWLAQGGCEAYLNLNDPPKWHDIAPGILIAEEAGAIVTDTFGKNFKKDKFNGLVVANNKSIHKHILDLIDD